MNIIQEISLKIVLQSEKSKTESVHWHDAIEQALCSTELIAKQINEIKKN